MGELRGLLNSDLFVILAYFAWFWSGYNIGTKKVTNNTINTDGKDIYIHRVGEFFLHAATFKKAEKTENDPPTAA